MIFRYLYLHLITTPPWQRWLLLVVILLSGYAAWHTFWYKPYARARAERDLLLGEIAQQQEHVLNTSLVHAPEWYKNHMLAIVQDTECTLEKLIVSSNDGQMRIEINVSGSYESLHDFIALCENAGLLWASAVMTETTLSGTLTLY